MGIFFLAKWGIFRHSRNGQFSDILSLFSDTNMSVFRPSTSVFTKTISVSIHCFVAPTPLCKPFRPFLRRAILGMVNFQTGDRVCFQVCFQDRRKMVKLHHLSHFPLFGQNRPFFAIPEREHFPTFKYPTTLCRHFWPCFQKVLSGMVCFQTDDWSVFRSVLRTPEKKGQIAPFKPLLVSSIKCSHGIFRAYLLCIIKQIERHSPYHKISCY